jgi:hypothetical protein
VSDLIKTQFKVAALDSEACADLLFRLAITRFYYRDLITITPGASSVMLPYMMMDYRQVTGQMDQTPGARRLHVVMEFLSLAQQLLAACATGGGLRFIASVIKEIREKRMKIRARFDAAAHHNAVITQVNTHLINASIMTRSIGIVGVSACALVATAGAAGVGASAGTAVARAAAAEVAKDTAFCYGVTKLMDGTIVALNEASVEAGRQQMITTCIGWLNTDNPPTFLPNTTVGVGGDFALAALHGAALKSFEEQLTSDLGRKCSEARGYLQRRLANDIVPMNPQIRLALGPHAHPSPRKYQKAMAAQNRRLRDFRRDEAVIDRQLQRQAGSARIRATVAAMAIPVVFFADDCVSAFRYYHEAQAGYEPRWHAPRPGARP